MFFRLWQFAIQITAFHHPAEGIRRSDRTHFAFWETIMSDPAARINLRVPATINFISLAIEAHGVIARNFGFNEAGTEDMAYCIDDVATLLVEGTAGFDPEAAVLLEVEASGDSYSVRLECIRPDRETDAGNSGGGKDRHGEPGVTGRGACRRPDNVWSKFGPAIASTMAKAFEAFEFTTDKNGDPALILKRPLPMAR